MSSSSSSSSSAGIFSFIVLGGALGALLLSAAVLGKEEKKKPKKIKAKIELDDSESSELFQVRSIESRKILIKGDKYIRTGKFDIAVKLYDNAIKELGTSAEAAAFYYQRGCLRAHKKMWTRAAEDGTNVIKLKPLLPHGFQLRGWAKLHLELLEESVADYEQAVNLEKTIERKHKKHVRRKNSKEDNNTNMRIPNLWTYHEPDLDKDEENEEDQDLSSSISSLDKKRVSFQEQAGDEKIEKIPSAKIMLVSCIASLSTRCLDAGQYAEAAKYLKRTQELAPEDYRNWLIDAQISQCYLSLGDGENTLIYAQRVRDQKPQDPRGYFLIGEAHLLLKQYKEAANAFHEALKLNPSFGEAQRKRAHAKSLIKKEQKKDRH